MEEIEAQGGMTKAVASGLPKRMIEEAATQKQAAVDKGETVVVGVNKFRLEEEAPLATREIDNSAVREAQIERLARVKKSRDGFRVKESLADLLAVAKTGKGNLLEAAVSCARARATVGEISDALRVAFGDHMALPEIVKGVHGGEYGDDAEYKILAARFATLAKSRKPKLLIAKLGQDGHDRGAKVIAAAFGDLGVDVIAGPLFQTPPEAAQLGISENVHVIGVSSLAAGHKTLIPELIETLKREKRPDIIVVCGGVIPRGDYDFLKACGVADVFGPGTNVLDAMRSVMDLLEGKRRNA